MNEFSHRNQPVASVTGATDRVTAIARIAPVSPMTPHTDASPDGIRPKRPATDVMGDVGHRGEDQSRAYADYAKVHEEIATILSDLSQGRANDNGVALGAADNAMAMLLPQPSIVLPLPPASEAMVAFIHQVRQSILTQAARTRAAMSNVTPATVEAATA